MYLETILELHIVFSDATVFISELKVFICGNVFRLACASRAAIAHLLVLHCSRKC